MKKPILKVSQKVKPTVKVQRAPAPKIPSYKIAGASRKRA